MPPCCLVLPLYPPLYYTWEGILLLAQGLVQRFALLLLFSVVWSAALHPPPQDKMHYCTCVLLNAFVRTLSLVKMPAFWMWSCVFLSSPRAAVIFNVIAVVQTLQVVSARTQPSQQSSGLALLERLLGQELHSPAWHLLISRDTHKYHTHGYLLLPPLDLFCCTQCSNQCL